ncbi:MAG: ATP-binding protein [Chitinophagales bacterium]|nr:ATP-binding protein [Chitinophagales bacterium]
MQDKFNLDDCIYGNIHLAVVEAVTNAIIHGNHMDINKNVILKSEVNSSSITFIVKDQGSGFDETSIPDPTLPENKEKLNGRGVFLIKKLADKVSFNENGTELQMIFHLS